MGDSRNMRDLLKFICTPWGGRWAQGTTAINFTPEIRPVQCLMFANVLCTGRESFRPSLTQTRSESTPGTAGFQVNLNGVPCKLTVKGQYLQLTLAKPTYLKLLISSAKWIVSLRNHWSCLLPYYPQGTPHLISDAKQGQVWKGGNDWRIFFELANVP